MNTVLLSFDIEEFDLPREHGVDISLTEGIKISDFGTNLILDILKKENVKATFFCTLNFAKNSKETIKRIINEGHELACHGVDHFSPKSSDPEVSKKELEKLFGVKIYGYRQPRMQKTDEKKMAKLGFTYDSSLNPTFIPGRYNHLKSPRTPFEKDGLVQIPASTTPTFRIPLFWLAFHNFPEKLYEKLALRTINRDKVFTVYFHPWEFFDLKNYKGFKAPWIIRNNSGKNLEKRLKNLIKTFKKANCVFDTYNNYQKSHKI